MSLQVEKMGFPLMRAKEQACKWEKWTKYGACLDEVTR
jgi:hypothetical protein